MKKIYVGIAVSAAALAVCMSVFMSQADTINKAVKVSYISEPDSYEYEECDIEKCYAQADSRYSGQKQDEEYEEISADDLEDEDVTGENLSIAVWGDSMVEGIGAGTAVIATEEGYKNITNYTAPIALQEFTGIATYNFGVGGELFNEIAIRAGGISLYLDRNLYINSEYPTRASLTDIYGHKISMSDYSGYGYSPNMMPHTCYINDVLCNVVQIPGTMDVNISICKNVLSSEKQYAFLPKGTIVVPKAAYEHKGDIQIIEMGSNGGWSSYTELIAQYQSIIANSGSDRYIIVGDTDDPGTSKADRYQQLMYPDGTYIGTNETMWEKALHDAFGEHFLNLRVYMIENGLTDCGVVPDAQDMADARKGIISAKLRFDWTHFNSYGYYAKGRALYLKGEELGYWD